MAKYQVYLSKPLDAAFQEYVEDNGGVANAALRKAVRDMLRKAGYPKPLSEVERTAGHLLNQERAESSRENRRARRRRG